MTTLHYLSRVFLYKDVGITRDYSVVHDMTRYDWSIKLNSMEDSLVTSGHVNFYRLPDSFRLQMKYEDARKVTYGRLILQNETEDAETASTLVPYFFWVDSVRLVTKEVVTVYDEVTGNPTDYEDVVEFTISEDVWSDYHQYAVLQDSYIERRHMPRWDSDGVPIYYPDAAQGVDGAYTLEKNEDLTPLATSGFLTNYDVRFILIMALDSDGKMHSYVGADMIWLYDGSEKNIRVPYGDAGGTAPLLNMQDILDGNFYTKAGLTAEYVQSITVLPYLSTLQSCVVESSSGAYIISTSGAGALGFSVELSSDNALGWLNMSSVGFKSLSNLMKKITTTVSNVLPAEDESSTYADTQEPMLYRSPARIRKVTDGAGDTVLDVPDIAALDTSWTCENAVETTSVSTVVYSGDTAIEGNAKGAFGSSQAPSLPIYESAWRTYEAISKTGDDITYNASQLSNAVNGIVGVVTGIAGAMAGGLGGAVAGSIGGSSAASSLTSIYTTMKELEAKRTTIRNNPCTVVSAGAGMGAYIHQWVDLRFLTLKLDDVSFRKLSDQYYFYGYFVNAVEHGEVDLHTRDVFDFIKTSGARVTGDAPQDALQEIASIFDRGVTIYHDYDKIGSGKTYANKEYTGASDT